LYRTFGKAAGAGDPPGGVRLMEGALGTGELLGGTSAELPACDGGEGVCTFSALPPDCGEGAERPTGRSAAEITIRTSAIPAKTGFFLSGSIAWGYRVAKASE
jgi:hypothetical protein